MQGNTNKNKKIAPIVAAVLTVGFLGAFLLTLVSGALGLGAGVFTVIVVIYAVVIIVVIAGVIAAMSQRLREIDNGEEEDAKKY